MPNLNEIVKIQKYATQKLDQVLLQRSKTAILVGSGNILRDTDFKGAGFVRVAKMTVDGLGDYSRVGQSAGDGYSDYNVNGRDGYPITGANLDWEDFKLDNDRGAQFRIGSMDNEETADLALGKLQETFYKTAVVPELDTMRFSKMASYCSETFGNLVSETLTANTIIAKFNAMFKYFADNEVEQDDQIIFVSTEVMLFINSTTELVRYMGVETRTINNGQLPVAKDGSANEMYKEITTAFKTFNGRVIIEVSPKRFYTDALKTQNGITSTSTSKDINFMGVSLSAVSAIVKLEQFKVFDSSVVQEFDGSKVNFRIYHDLLVTERAQKAIYLNVSARSTVARELFVDYTNETAGSVLVSLFRTKPSGLNGILAWVAGGSADVNAAQATYEKVLSGVESSITAGSGNFALIDVRTNKVQAKSATVTLA